MGASEFFSYLSAFVTIVLAVALADMIQSTHRLLRARRRVKWDVLPLIFALLIAISVVSEFFALWDRVAIAQVSIERLLWLLLEPTLFALLAYSALPDDIPAEGLDLTEFYHSERRLWAGLFGLILIVDTARSFDLFISDGRPIADLIRNLVPLLLVMGSGLALMAFSRHRLGHIAAVILISAGIIYAIAGWSIGVKTDASDQTPLPEMRDP